MVDAYKNNCIGCSWRIVKWSTKIFLYNFMIEPNWSRATEPGMGAGKTAASDRR